MQKSAESLGASFRILDVNDGQLMPTLENRMKVLSEIRCFNADLVITHRPNDYHPDHRYTSKLVEDSAYLVIVPLINPTVHALKKNPVFAYFRDGFKKPNKFSNDVVVDITSVIEDKIKALANHESQVFEWLPWTEGKLEYVSSLNSENEKMEFLKKEYLESIDGLCESESLEIKEKLEYFYGNTESKKCKYFESFEFCEYGKRLQPKNYPKLFPMLPLRN